jgi:hypothetical protein
MKLKRRAAAASNKRQMAIDGKSRAVDGTAECKFNVYCRKSWLICHCVQILKLTVQVYLTLKYY